VLPAQVLNLSQDTLPASRTNSGEGREETPSQAYEVRLAPQRTALRGRHGLCRLRLGMDMVADVVTRRTTVAVFLLNKLRLSN
jgi:hypothetical protein